jgi:PTH1 family peptidyl-tRNA hydrolase
MIRLVVGLGNPGNEYANTRHNAGVWYLQALATQLNCALRSDKKFQAEYANCTQPDVKLLYPTTFMNNSGHSVAQLLNFFKILPSEMLVAHDELDLPVGCVRLKLGGGSGGHNGLKSIIEHLGGDQQFYRLRLGIGHPGERHQVTNFVLGKTPDNERRLIEDAIDRLRPLHAELLQGNIANVMKQLHTPQSTPVNATKD